MENSQYITEVKLIIQFPKHIDAMLKLFYFSKELLIISQMRRQSHEDCTPLVLLRYLPSTKAIRIIRSVLNLFIYMNVIDF